MRNRNERVSLSPSEFILVVGVLRLAKQLCIDLEATTSGNERAVEVRLLRTIERLEAIGLC